METIVIIPARMNSRRLPGKPLKQIGDEIIVSACCRNADASIADRVYIATPDSEIFWVVNKRKVAGLINPAIVTSNKPINGTERVAEAARLLGLEPDDIVVNLQGDIPFFDPEIINEPVRLLKTIPDCNIASVRTMLSKEDYDNPNKVKVVVDIAGKASAFGRQYEENAHLHIGVYVFRNEFLQKYDRYGSVAKERRDHLEQQRIIHMGEPIYMAHVNNYPTVIDTQEDLEKAQC